MTINVLIKRKRERESVCFKVVFDKCFIFSCITFWKQKNRSYRPKKMFAAIFFAAFLIPDNFPMELWQSLAFFDLVNVICISYDGIWKKKKRSKILNISKIVWNFEYYLNSLDAFPFPIWILTFDNDVIGCIQNQIEIYCLLPRAPFQVYLLGK